MRKFRAIIQSNTEPQDRNVIWKHGDKLFYWDGAWKDIIANNASDIVYTHYSGVSTSVEQALNAIYRSMDIPLPSPGGKESLILKTALTKRKAAVGDTVKLVFSFTVGTSSDTKYAEVSIKVSKAGLTVPIYENILGDYPSSKNLTFLEHEVDLTSIISSNNIDSGTLEVELMVNYTSFYINDEGEEIPYVIQKSENNILVIGEPDYTIIEIDESILDESSHTYDSKGNITNLDNNTGAKTSTPYVPSRHISTILQQCHRYLGKLVKKGNTVPLEGNPNDPSDMGKTFPGVDNTGAMLLIQLDDLDSQYYNTRPLGGNKVEAPLDGALGHGEVGVKIPGFWYKGVNFNSPQNSTLSKKYICFSSNSEAPDTSIETKTIYIRDLILSNAVGSKDGIYKKHKYIKYTNKADSILDRIPEETFLEYTIFRIDVEGFKKLRYPVTIGDSICSVFTDSAGVVLADSEGSVINYGEVNVNNPSRVYNGMGVITTIPKGAKYFYMTLCSKISESSEVLSDPCDIVLHRGLGFESGDEMNEDNAKDWIADMEPNWVYSDPVFIHATECAVDDSGDLYTPFDGTKTPVKGEEDENIGLLTNGDWTQYSMRNAAYNRGLQLIDYEASKLIAILFMAKYGRRNSQYQLGSGLSSRSRKLGVTRAYGMRDTVIPKELGISGSYSSAAIEISPANYEYPGSPSFLGIEDVHGNVSEWLERAYYSNISSEDCGFLQITMPDLSTRKVYGVTPTNNTPRFIVHGKYCDILSCSQNAGSEVTGYADYQKTNTTLQDTWATTLGVARSSYSYHASGGIFCLDGCSAVGYADSYIGSRLMFRGDMTETVDIDLFESTEEIR